MDLFPQILEQARAFSWIDWTVTITAIIYVVLAAREKIWCWFWGIISCGLWAYATLVFYHLWLDAMLQVFYVVMGFVGLYQWKLGQIRSRPGDDRILDDAGAIDNYQSEEPLVRPTTSMTPQEHLIYWIIIIPATLFFGYFFANYTPAAATYADAFTSILSIVATFILVQKKLETWLYWILADGLYIWLYSRQGAYLFALLMVIYVIIAVVGYFSWRKQMKTPVGIQG